ncbi:MAG: DUF2946 family protein [Roseiarcus sp.]|jgi:hypothetical protein
MMHADPRQGRIARAFALLAMLGAILFNVVDFGAPQNSASASAAFSTALADCGKKTDDGTPAPVHPHAHRACIFCVAGGHAPHFDRAILPPSRAPFVTLLVGARADRSVLDDFVPARSVYGTPSLARAPPSEA